jgi:dihydroorotate dehydrogenase (NAD+) catalytic subunit
MKPSLETDLCGIKLKNPVMVASGTFGYGEEFQEGLYDIKRLGAVVTKGISLRPRQGNEMPRVCETASGMLNAIGLANVGADKFLSEKLPYLLKNGATVIANVFGSSIEEYVEVAAKMDGADGVAAIELNISCPNVKSGGVQFGTDPLAASEVVREVKKVYKRPLIVKLSPLVSDIKGMARACVNSGADAISLINTIPAMAVDVKTRRPRLANVVGGLSGPAIKPVAVRLVYEVAKAVDVPVIGLGGISTLEDALEFFLVGARAIQIGTANFTRPNAAIELIDELKKYFASEKISSISEIVGAVRA